jgi:hypothetical protein
VVVDPFEILGRSLASYHPRIRNVPYIPAVGFTDTHEAFLSQADAVIVVLCEPQSSKRESLKRQLAFAERTCEALGGGGGGGYYGGPVRNPPILVGSSAFHASICCSWRWNVTVWGRA